MALSPFTDSNIPDYKYWNYYTSGGYAYTENHILVTKLFIHGIPPKTTHGFFRKSMLRFGGVKKLSFIRNRDFPKSHTNTFVAYVYFENAKAAARVLNFYHNVREAMTLYNVEVCSSWKQPNCKFTKQMLQDWSNRPTESGEEDKFVPPNRNSILVLNDYCLDNIIRFLPIPTQLVFARSCSRICRVYERTCKSLYRTLSVELLYGLTLWPIWDFFKFAGEYINCVEGNVRDEYQDIIVNYITKYCMNIEKLELKSNSIRLFGLDSFLNLFPKLKKLKSLKLPEQYLIQGHDLISLPPSIESLALNICSPLADKHIISLCQLLTNLKELDFSAKLHLNEAVVNAMVVSCPNLEALTFHYSQSDYGLISKLPKLKKLTFNIALSYNPAIFTQLVEHKSHLLEYLHLRYVNCIPDNIAQQISRLKALRTLICPIHNELTEKGLNYLSDLDHLEDLDLRNCKANSTALLNLMLKCTKLKRVHIHGCYLISNQLMHEIKQNMHGQIQNESFMCKEFVTLMARFTKLKVILNAPKHKAFSHLSFDNKVADGTFIQFPMRCQNCFAMVDKEDP